MRYKIFVLALFLVLNFISTTNVLAATTNAGFVKSNIWYSKDNFEEGDKIKIYTVVFNPDSKTFSGTVVFFDNSVFLGKKSFTLKAKEATDVSIDWTVNYGSHSIFAKIEDAKFLLSNGTYESVYLADDQSEKNTFTVKQKVLTETKDTVKENLNETVTKTSGQIQNIQKSIVENTPAAVSKPIISATNKIEEFREDLSTKVDDKKEEAKQELSILNGEINKKPTPTDTESNSLKDTKNTVLKEEIKDTGKLGMMKPLKQVEVFFLTLFSLILNNKFLFYGLVVFVLFLIFRFIWNKFL
ncbi:MAG: hypothetical protein AAB438_02405 [Patescibacteria group bacterium]